MVTDTLVSLGVVISGVIIILTGIQWVDPLVSLVIVVVILYGTWGLLRDTTKMALDAVPLNIDSVEVRKFLESTEGVENVHDLHIWAMSTSQNALTAHLVVPDIEERKDFLVLLERSIRDKFKIGHSTFQIESSKPEDSHHCDC
jgi:cobalt-zinc-cadmium efflux system protein